jgi:cob(I)alamin adenosyltransferase
LIQVYTGNGKGKTTAALGLALRAAGAGLKVYIAQFVKGGYSSELEALKKIKNIKVETFGRAGFIRNVGQGKDVQLAHRGLKKIKRVLSKKLYDLIILDEVNVAIQLKLLALGDILSLIRNAPRKVELILTGRDAHPKILKEADLISQIKQLRHYFKKGMKARKGIEF